MGTAAVPVGTAGYCGYCGYCRVLGTVGTVGVYCRVLQGTAGYCRVHRKLELRVLYATLTGIETGYEIS